ncbi:MAG: (d)CMP kinase [Clostridia bacterium]|nr:(d)CMP kinase [Clostridia bacterium]
MIIAIDGPSGAGKSTLSKKLAKRLGFVYIDTGALYRTVGLKFINKGVQLDNTALVEEVLSDTTVDINYVNAEQRVYLDGVDVSDEIRTPEVSLMASAVSALPEVRAFLLGMQRSIANGKNVILDGRDIGTVVFPNAEIKIFLSASAKERAKRRYEELIAKGQDVTYEQVLEDLEKRDYNDSHRAIAPLKQAEDAYAFDTTGNTFEQSLDLLVEYLKTKGVE